MATLKYSNICKALLTLSVSVLALNVFALNSDLKKVVTITADSVEYNHKTGISTYSGHIHATQGTTKLDANRVVVYRSKKNKITKIVAMGKLAHYETLPDGQKNKIHARAKTIEYYPLKEKIILIGDADADFDKNHLSGQHITYNIASQTAISKPSPGGKTTIVLEPRATTTKSTVVIPAKAGIQPNNQQRKTL